ncbi:hypothetical protein [Bartonella raoultii]|uniref:Transposase n=1 Tax=Bartonella raoultii TaxID=1457020 RepID=A0ABS7I6S9_9HYPH|nr:hypothetical protein [Bartonella raoultii]MBX4336613.1 hypothetical protein [Bartonella raoultii]
MDLPLYHSLTKLKNGLGRIERCFFKQARELSQWRSLLREGGGPIKGHRHLSSIILDTNL